MIWPFRPRRRANNWMCTFSGVMYWPSDPRVEDVRIVDIAHHLSRICRYTGAVKVEHYSVAEHSVLVSHMVPPEHALDGLLHDAPEAYCNDLSRPLKTSLPDYKKIEERNWRVIAEKFRLTPVLPECVHVADIRVYLTERAALMPPHDEDVGLAVYDPAPVTIRALAPNAAEKLFMERYYELTRWWPSVPRGVPADGSPAWYIPGVA